MAWFGSSGGVLAVLVPHCPFCATASGTLLSSMGLGFLATSGVGRWLVPLFLLLGLVGLGVGWRLHRASWVLALGIVGSLIVYGGWSFERLDLRQEPGAPAAEVRARVEAKLESVEAKMRELKRLRAALRDLKDACCAGGSASDCPILDALDDGKLIVD